MSYKNRFTRLRASHLRVGKRGENIACKFLYNKNYEILCRNFKCPAGEIDIIARDGKILVFIEVKTRKYPSAYRPVASLSYRQKKRIINAAKCYINEINIQNPVYRFDVMEIFLSSWGNAKIIKHWKRYSMTGEKQ